MDDWSVATRPYPARCAATPDPRGAAGAWRPPPRARVAAILPAAGTPATGRSARRSPPDAMPFTAVRSAEAVDAKVLRLLWRRPDGAWLAGPPIALTPEAEGRGAQPS